MPNRVWVRAGASVLVLSVLAASAACSSGSPKARQTQTSKGSVAQPTQTSKGSVTQPTQTSLVPLTQPTQKRPLNFSVAAPDSESAKIAALFGRGFLPRSGGAFGVDRIHAMPGGGPGGSPALRVDYPAGSASARAAATSGSGFGGAQVYLLLPKGPVDSLQLRYCFRFPVGFDFVKGGKMPGLFGGTVNNGQHIPDGTNGWSTRYMWRRGGAGEVYAYLPSSVVHGTSLGRGKWRFTPGIWQCLSQVVTLNTPGKADGAITVWLDGRQVFKQVHVVFRTTGSLKVDGVFFSTFFGGGDASWAAPIAQHVDFADFAFGV